MSDALKTTVLEVLTQVLEDKGDDATDLSDGRALGEEGLGLDSLDMATVVAELEDQLGVDPFAHGNANFRTVGELVTLYRSAT